MSKPIPVYVKWYETKILLDEKKGVPYLRSRPDPAIFIRNGGVFSVLEDSCESWKVNWNREANFGYTFEPNGRENLNSQLSIQVPILSISDTWLPNGATFDLSRRLNNRVNQLIRFVQVKELLVPYGTLFILTRPGIQEALDHNESRSFVIGYSGAEPTPVGKCTPLTSNPPEMWLPNILKAVRVPDPVRVSRYARPWVI
jgi:hypothetical protein